MIILPEDPRCPNCDAQTWSRIEPRAREYQGCGYIQRLLTDREHWLREQAEIDAGIASGA